MSTTSFSTSTPGPGSIAQDHSTAGDSQLVVAGSRPRQTEAPPAPFRDVLAGSVSVLMSGAEVATHVLAGPVMAAAVHQAGATAALAVTTGPAAVVPGAMPGALAGAPGAPGQPVGDLAVMQSMQRESQAFNMQLLALQEEVQQENRRFTTLSNLLRAKHDTAKAAVSNIRS